MGQVVSKRPQPVADQIAVAVVLKAEIRRKADGCNIRAAPIVTILSHGGVRRRQRHVRGRERGIPITQSVRVVDGYIRRG